MGIGLAGFALILFVFFAAGFALFWIAVRCGAGFWPSFGRCLLAFIAAMLVSQLVGLALGVVLKRAFVVQDELADMALLGWQLGALNVVMLMVATAGAVHWIVHRPDGSALSMGRSLRVAAVFAALCLLLGGGIYAAFVLR
jgi:hypothetical protein